MDYRLKHTQNMYISKYIVYFCENIIYTNIVKFLGQLKYPRVGIRRSTVISRQSYLPFKLSLAPPPHPFKTIMSAPARCHIRWNRVYGDIFMVPLIHSTNKIRQQLLYDRSFLVIAQIDFKIGWEVSWFDMWFNIVKPRFLFKQWTYGPT